MNKGALLQAVEATQQKKSLPDLRTGDTARVHYKIKEGNKERIQVFEGLIIATKKLKTLQASITVRKVSVGVGVERTFPLHSPWISKLERVKRSRVRRAKLYFIRRLTSSAKRLRFKDKQTKPEVWEDVVAPEQNQEEPVAEPETEAQSPEQTMPDKDDSSQSAEPVATEKEAEKSGASAPKTDDQSKSSAGTDGGESGESVSAKKEAKDPSA